MTMRLKYSFLMLLLLTITTKTEAQKDYKKIFDEQKNYHRLQLTDADYDYKFTVLAVCDIKPSVKCEYTWYLNNAINTTQGNFGGKLLHGTYSKYLYKTHQLVTKGSYEKGVKTGIWHEWNPDGTFSSVVEYKNGYKHGNASFYDTSGNLIEECSFKEGKKDGKSTTYVDGKKQESVSYKNGIERKKDVKKEEKLEEQETKKEEKEKKEKAKKSASKEDTPQQKEKKEKPVKEKKEKQPKEKKEPQPKDKSKEKEAKPNKKEKTESAPNTSTKTK